MTFDNSPGCGSSTMMPRPLKFDVPKALYPFDHKFLDLGNGIDIHYVDEGEGESLLMLHGNPAWSFLYRKMILRLRDTFRCIAPDHPGFGLTEAPPGYRFTPREHSETVERFVDTLGIKDLNLVAQDWGGPVGLGLASRRPELVKGVILGNTFAWRLQGARNKTFSWVMGGPIGRAMAYSFNGVARFFFVRGLIRRPEKEVLRMYLAPFKDRKNRRQTSISPWLLVRATDYLDEVEVGLDQIKDKPALLTWGTKDFAFRDADRRRFERAFPNHRTVLLEASHFWQEEAADEASEAIIQWMKRMPAEESSAAGLADPRTKKESTRG